MRVDPWMIAVVALLSVVGLAVAMSIKDCEQERKEMIDACLRDKPAYECKAMFAQYCRTGSQVIITGAR